MLAIEILFPVIAAAVVLATLLLRRRDKSARAQGKTVQQIQASFDALMQLKSTVERAIPGVLLLIFGIFFGLDRYKEHDPEWWYCLIFIALGWFLVPLLARKSWRRYRELREFADRDPKPYIHYDPVE